MGSLLDLLGNQVKMASRQVCGFGAQAGGMGMIRTFERLHHLVLMALRVTGVEGSPRDFMQSEKRT